MSKVALVQSKLCTQQERKLTQCLKANGYLLCTFPYLLQERGEPVDQATLSFEKAMIDVLLNTSGYPEGLRAYPNVARSFGDISGETILGDVVNMVVGYMILTSYAQLMLGRFNCVENR